MRNAIHLLKMPGAQPEMTEKARAVMERQLQHLVRLVDDTAEAKMKIMRECNIHVVDSPADIGKTMAAVMNA